MNIGTLLIWFGLIAYVILTYDFRFMLCCLAACSSYLFLFVYANNKMACALHTVHAFQDAVDGPRAGLDADAIYEELSEYWGSEAECTFAKVCRSDFLDRFETNRNEATMRLAEEIYDDWF